MSPKDFWSLRPEEFWMLVEAHKPIKMYGKTPEHVIDAIYRETYGEYHPPEEE